MFCNIITYYHLNIILQQKKALIQNPQFVFKFFINMLSLNVIILNLIIVKLMKKKLLLFVHNNYLNRFWNF